MTSNDPLTQNLLAAQRREAAVAAAWNKMLELLLEAARISEAAGFSAATFKIAAEDARFKVAAEDAKAKA